MSTDRNDVLGRINEAAAASGEVGHAQTTAAYYLLDDLMAVARHHGVRLTDFDAVTGLDLPTACLQVAGAGEAYATGLQPTTTDSQDPTPEGS